MGDVEAYVVVAAAVFGINLLPAFGPPTWAVLVLFHLHGDYKIPLLVFVGAAAAASGRLLLALATRHLARYLPMRQQQNLEAANEILTRRRSHMTAALVLFALSPLPSAQLFEAAGMVTIRLVPVTAAFFVGRTISYALYIGGARALSTTDTGKVLLSSLTSPWGLGLEIVMIVALVVLARMDWRKRFHLGRQP